MDAQLIGELLCRCLDAGTKAQQLDHLPAPDWHDIIELATKQCLAPLLYKRLKALGPSANIPSTVLHTLQETYLHSSGESMRLRHQLSTLLKALQEASVPVIALKGAHLAHVVYSNPALRPMQDLDLLVKKDNLPDVEAKLLAMGYVPMGDKAWQEENHYHIHYYPPDGASLPVEIHWNIVYPASYQVDVAGLWARTRPAQIVAQTLVLSPEDLLLHLCLHASHHLFEIGLKSFCDLAEVIRYYQAEMDWPQIQCRARQWRADRCVYLTLHLAQKLMGIDVPNNVLHALEPEGSAHFVDWAEERLFELAITERPEFANWGRWGAAQGWGEKVSILIKACFPSKHYLTERYIVPPNSVRIYLYYLAYWQRLVHEHAMRAWRLLCADRETKIWVEQQTKKLEQQAYQKTEIESFVKWVASA